MSNDKLMAEMKVLVEKLTDMELKLYKCEEENKSLKTTYRKELDIAYVSLSRRIDFIEGINIKY